MLYKRTEYFRYTFGEPLSAKFRLQKGNGLGRLSSPGECSLIDLSPNGGKIFTKFDIPMDFYNVGIVVSFTLFNTSINAQGEIVWKKVTRNGYLYGIQFEKDERRAALIIEELKMLGKEELKNRKKSK